MLQEITGEFPALSRVFVTERDMYLARSLKFAAQPLPCDHTETGKRLDKINLDKINFVSCWFCRTWDWWLPNVISWLKPFQFQMKQRNISRGWVDDLSMMVQVWNIRNPKTFPETCFIKLDTGPNRLSDIVKTTFRMIFSDQSQWLCYRHTDSCVSMSWCPMSIWVNILSTMIVDLSIHWGMVMGISTKYSWNVDHFSQASVC